MKKMKKRIDKMIVAWHMRWVVKHLPEVTLAARENLIWQMWRAGIKLHTINLWLRWRQQKPILYYVVIEPGVKMKYFTAEPDADVKADLRRMDLQLVSVH